MVSNSSKPFNGHSQNVMRIHATEAVTHDAFLGIRVQLLVGDRAERAADGVEAPAGSLEGLSVKGDQILNVVMPLANFIVGGNCTDDAIGILFVKLAHPWIALAGQKQQVGVFGVGRFGTRFDAFSDSLGSDRPEGELAYFFGLGSNPVDVAASDLAVDAIDADDFGTEWHVGYMTLTHAGVTGQQHVGDELDVFELHGAQQQRPVLFGAVHGFAVGYFGFTLFASHLLLSSLLEGVILMQCDPDQGLGLELVGPSEHVLDACDVSIEAGEHVLSLEPAAKAIQIGQAVDGRVILSPVSEEVGSFTQVIELAYANVFGGKAFLLGGDEAVDKLPDLHGVNVDGCTRLSAPHEVTNDFQVLFCSLLFVLTEIEKSLLTVDAFGAEPLTISVQGKLGHSHGTGGAGTRLDSPMGCSIVIHVVAPNRKALVRTLGKSMVVGSGCQPQKTDRFGNQLLSLFFQANSIRSSIGQSIGLRNRGLQVRALPSAFFPLSCFLLHPLFSFLSFY